MWLQFFWLENYWLENYWLIYDGSEPVITHTYMMGFGS